MIFVLNRPLGKLTQKERLPSSRLVEAKGLLFFCVNKRCCNAFFLSLIRGDRGIRAGSGFGGS